MTYHYHVGICAGVTNAESIIIAESGKLSYDHAVDTFVGMLSPIAKWRGGEPTMRFLTEQKSKVIIDKEKEVLGHPWAHGTRIYIVCCETCCAPNLN